MKKKKIYILGSGNVGIDVLEIYSDLNRKDEIAGFIEENCRREGEEICGIKVFDYSIIDKIEKSAVFAAAMGSPLKKRIIEDVLSKGFKFDTIIHPSALIGRRVNIGRGSIIYHGSILTRDIEIGEFVLINAGVSISHKAEVKDFSTIGPGVNIAGDVKVGGETWIGIGATIIDKVEIGRGTCIGAGAVVVSDIPDKVLAIGIPAKPVKTWESRDWTQICRNKKHL